MALTLLASIILGAIWPVSIPAIWIIRSCVDSSWSCFGFNYPTWKAKKQARKQERAQEIEMDRMERAQQAEDDQTRQRNEEPRNLEEAKERVRLKKESMLGRGTVAGGAQESSSSSSNSDGSRDNIEAVAGMPNANTRHWNQ